jgi:hypothetical protein
MSEDVPRQKDEIRISLTAQDTSDITIYIPRKTT